MGLGDIKNIFQQALKVKNDMKKKQKELENQVISIDKNGLNIKINGNQEIISIKIDEKMNLKDLKKLEILIKNNINEAIQKSKKLLNNEISKITKNLNIPGL